MDRLFVIDNVGGPSRVRVFGKDGRPLPNMPLPPVSRADEIVPVGGGSVLFPIETYVDPPAWYSYRAADGKAVRTALLETSPIRFDDAEVVREFATSKDGTRVPLNIIRLKTTKLDGTAPVLLTAYGGYGHSEKPSFDGYIYGYGPRIWLDQGGIFVEANVRGGGEYGEEWHREGSLTLKQNVFDDFFACAQYSIDRKYTSPAHLAILGASNGGLLTGAAITQRPNLFRSAVLDSGFYDMLRFERAANGEFNTTEFGSVKNLAQFKALFAYSPYHHVVDGTAYPAIYLFSGENDNRVDPMHSRKMAARLQAANVSRYPILLRAESNAGHGWGEALEVHAGQGADIFSFLFDQLAIDFQEKPADKR
jgi:prolyl oligopeptidase